MRAETFARLFFRMLTASGVILAANAGPKINSTIKPRSAGKIAGSNWTLGCETLDRDFTDYQEYKQWLGQNREGQANL